MPIFAEFYNNQANIVVEQYFFRNIAENNKFKSIFRYNFVINGGGIFFYNKTNNNRFDCDFIFNVVNSSAGAIAFFGTIDNNNFTGWFINNSALGGGSDVMNGDGGAIYFEDIGNVFNFNFTNNIVSDGGAILACGNLTVTNSIFKDNIAIFGTNHLSLKKNAKVTLINVLPNNIGSFYISNLTVLDVKDVAYGNAI